MIRIFIGFMICFLFLNCAKNEKQEENIPYVISQENHEIIHGKDTMPAPLPPPGWLVYGTNTFILNSDSTAYYFQRKGMAVVCGTPTADTIPYFTNLQPSEIIELSNKNIYDFIKLNYRDDFRNQTFIASQSDTLNSKMFFDLNKSLNLFKRDRDFVIIRRTTQEEDTVLKYKKDNCYYDYKEIKWDQKKIKFPEIPKQVKFIKSKI